MIKCLAMLAMTLDHVAWAFLKVDSHLSEWLHFIGRMAALHWPYGCAHHGLSAGGGVLSYT